MVRFIVLALALAGGVVSCGKVTDPNATDAAPHGDGAIDGAQLTKPVAAIKSVGIAGASVTCTVATPSTGGTVTYVASWTINDIPFTEATTTTVTNDTIPGSATHTGNVVECTLFASNGSQTVQADPVSVTMKPRTAFTVDRVLKHLETIDLDTLTLTDVGALNVAFAFGDLAWDAKNQILYMVDGEGAKALYTVDITTGAATLVGTHGVTDVFALAIDPTTEQLYAGTIDAANTLELANTTSGALTAVGGTFAFDGMAFDTKRTEMVGVNADDAGATLVTVNLTTGATTTLAAAGDLDDNGLTYDPFTDQLWAADNNGQIVAWDPNNSYARTVSTTITGSFNALAIQLPAPAAQ